MGRSSSPITHRLKVGDLQVGTPLPFDVFDSGNRLLLRRGNRINSESQLDRLIRQGIFYEGSENCEASGGQADCAVWPAEGERPCSSAPEVSAFLMLDECALTLDSLLRTHSSDPGAGHFAERIGELVAQIRRLCLSDSDATLAYVLLRQAPHYLVRQQLNVALLSALMLSRLAGSSVRSEAAISAALTMNIGLMDLQQELYAAAPPLDVGQRAAVREHPMASARILRDLGVDEPGWLEIIEQHHEALDGSGYPRGISGAQICTEARVIAIADRYSSMVMHREYRRGIAPDLALRELARREAGATDPELLGLLIRVIGVYPPGTVVSLVNREVGVVTTRLLDLKHPIVCTLFLDPHWPYDKPIRRFTGRMPQFAISKVLSRDELNLTISPEQLWPPVHLLDPDWL